MSEREKPPIAEEKAQQGGDSASDRASQSDDNTKAHIVRPPRERAHLTRPPRNLQDGDRARSSSSPRTLPPIS